MSLPNGTRLGPYEIAALLGSGGMGEVYKAVDKRLGRLVALKVLHGNSFADPRKSSRLRKEARALAAVGHPRICAVYDVCEGGDVEFIVMELIEGQTLAATLASKGPFRRDDLLAAAAELADGLAAAHQNGIVHGDLKPANVMVTSRGLKILDFGLASGAPVIGDGSTTRSSDSSHRTVRGTLQYLSPEAVDGRPIDERSDVFALGAILHELATGQPAFAAATPAATLAAVLNLEVSSLAASRPDLPTTFAEVVAHCLKKVPEDRYRTARDVHADLARLGLALRSREALRRAAGGTQVRLRGTERAKRAIAVLPFVDLSDSKDHEYFADGIAEALITSLGATGKIHVIGWTSASALKGSRLSAREIGATLQVDTIVEGSVRRQNRSVVVAVRLVSAPSGVQRWSKTLTYPETDLAELQAGVAKAIAEELDAMTAARRRAVTVDPAAHDAYLRGVFLLNNQPDDWQDACRTELERAISLSPRYAAAHAALSRWHNFTARTAPSDAVVDRTALARAEHHARLAIEADPKLADGYSAAARVHFYELRIPDALRSWKRATELDAACASAWAGLAMCYTSLAETEAALACIDRALAIEPFSTSIRNNAAIASYGVRAYERCIRDCENGLTLSPRHWVLHCHKGLSYMYLKDHARAEQSLQYALECRPGHPQIRAALGILACERGDLSAANMIATELRSQNVETFSLAWLCCALGQTELVLTLLESLFKDRSPYLLELKGEPAFDRLRDHPRWQRLVRALNLDRE